MPEITSFVNGWNRSLSPVVDTEETHNFFVESTAPGYGKGKQVLMSKPGKKAFASTAGSGVGRGIFFQDGRCFVVIGTHFYELTDNNDNTGTLTNYGTVVNDDTPASMCSNGTAGHQVMITSGGFGYIFDLIANTLVQITDAGFPANVGQCLFTDGYFAVAVRSSRIWQISDRENGLSWDPLNFAERQIASDNIVSFVRLQRTICLLGSHSSEFWYNTGDADFPFAPVQGAFMELGSAAAYSAIRFGDTGSTLAWLGANANGQGTVHLMNGFDPAKVSTATVDLYIQITSGPPIPFDDDLSGAIAFGQQFRGHQWFWLYLPNTARWTPVFDLTEKVWLQFDEWNKTTCQYEPDAAIDGTQAFGRFLVVSRLNGVVYALDQFTYRDELLV
jgi:hypothetical protein